MHTIIIILSYMLLLFIGFFSGYLMHRGQQSRDSSGVMKVIKDEDRVLYSLELYEDPKELENMTEVVFKVENSDKSSDRK